MSQSANTEETLNGHFKEVYSENIKDLRPSGVKLVGMISFLQSAKHGKAYNQPVTLGYEFGFTYGDAKGSVVALEAAVAAAHDNASIKSNSLLLSSYLSIDAASRSTSSKAAFISETKHIVENMYNSFMFRLEAVAMYGQSGIGIVESITGNVVKIEKEEWAAGLWAGAENMPLEIRSSAGVLRGVCSVTAVSMVGKTITVDGVPAGTVATDIIYHKGAYGNENVGLHKIVSNTSGTLFGIDASAYSLFQGNIVDVGTNFSGNEAVLSFDKIEEAIAVMQEKGLQEEEVTVICNPKSWKNLLTELSAKRSYDQSYSSAKLEQGAREILFHGPNGMIKIVSSTFCKEGYAYIINPKHFDFVGSSEVTFDQPGLGGKMVRQMERASGYEFRTYCDMALFTSSPGRSALLRYIKS